MKINFKKYNLIYFIVGLYCLAILITVGAIYQIPKQYEKVQQEQYRDIQLQVNQVLENGWEASEFQRIEEAYPIELVIFNEDMEKIVYGSVPIATPSQLPNALNRLAIANEEGYEVTINQTKYYVWLAQYHISPQFVINQWFIWTSFSIGILFTALTAICLTIFVRTVRPLEHLRDNVVKLGSYQLEQLQEGRALRPNEQEQLSKELVDFSQDLLGKMNQVELNYTALEKELQRQIESGRNRESLLVTEVHDLKTPLNTIRLHIEKMQQQHLFDDATITNFLADAHTKIDKTITEINELIMITQSQDADIFHHIEVFDLIDLLTGIINKFSSQFQFKDFDVENEIDMEVLMSGNKLRMKQLIHNALSNICAYAPEHAKVIISCYVEQDEIILKFYNDGSQLPAEQIENVFNLFYRISTDKTGSGLGLHSVKMITLEHQGTVTFQNVNEGVELTCKFPTPDKVV